jgi:DNA-binding response OmpR family regulator
MDASAISADEAVQLYDPGRFTRVLVQTRAGEIEARLSEYGNWELRVRRHEDSTWRLACVGDLDCGAVTTQPVLLPDEETIVRGHLTIEPANRRVNVGDIDVVLSRKEFALLLALASQPNRVFSKAELLESIWDHSGDARTRTLDSHASRLRRKLAAAGASGMVVNSWGIGYRLWDRPDLAGVPPLEAVDRAT